MDQGIDKRALVAAVRTELEAELARITRRALAAAEGATHEENRPEGDKDMRSTEAAYLARGQAQRAQELELALARLDAMPVRAFAPGDAIQASALVEVASDGRTTRYLLVPVAGGLPIRTAGVVAQTLATTSPLGRALLGLTEGDDVDVTTPQGTRSYAIVGVV